MKVNDNFLSIYNHEHKKDNYCCVFVGILIKKNAIFWFRVTKLTFSYPVWYAWNAKRGLYF